MIHILSVNISEKKGTIKTPVSEIHLTFKGVEGDAHAGDWNRQVSLLGMESIDKFRKKSGKDIKCGEFAENITTKGLELWKVHPLDRFTSPEAELEVTQIGKKCHGPGCVIFNEVGDCIMPKEGIFCRVIRPGILKPGMELDYIPKTYKIRVITLSDRASKGVYEDKSGPELIRLINDFFSKNGLHCKTTLDLIPDDPGQLEKQVKDCKYDGTDILFTTGGTGIGPRDITPEVIRLLLDKEIPGIMEMIRIKYGSEKPQVLLSRSIAGTIGSTIVFTLPGSMKAVGEYFEEISKNLIHAIYMIHSLDNH
ncbi:MAG: molybdopterin-binding protein [Bacteroidota bacterium]|nr:molybdopterin-binding protein [Bacteroidota bacterium]